jgi:hypothetical protein
LTVLIQAAGEQELIAAVRKLGLFPLPSPSLKSASAGSAATDIIAVLRQEMIIWTARYFQMDVFRLSIGRNLTFNWPA